MQTVLFNQYIKSKLIFLFAAGTMLFSCDDIFEEDLTDDIIVLNSPSDNDTSVVLSQHFVWEEADEATQYRIQIVSPSFSTSYNLVLDSTLSSNQIYFTLSPGVYQWRVKAINYSSESNFSVPFTLVIDTTSDLTNQIVLLSSPADGANTNDTLPYFQWQAMGIADSYNIIVKAGTNWNTGVIIIDDTTAANNYASAVVFNEGQYTWGIRAINSNSYTTSFNPRSLNIDLTDPPVPVLAAPANSSSQTAGNISFSWSRPADIGTCQSPRFDSLFVFSDTAMTQLTGNFQTSNLTYQLNLSQSDTYFWYLIGYDEAGNKSDTSQIFSFTIQ
jgi:hypothetical protein